MAHPFEHRWRTDTLLHGLKTGIQEWMRNMISPEHFLGL
jgi:hypothetical protein